MAVPGTKPLPGPDRNPDRVILPPLENQPRTGCDDFNHHDLLAAQFLASLTHVRKWPIHSRAPPVVAARDAFVANLFNASHFLDHAAFDCGVL